MGSNDSLVLQPDGDKLKWPEPPKFASLEDERLHRKQRLAISFRIFGEWGFDWGIGGHVTCRDPILTDHFWVNPIGVHFARMKTSDLVLVNEAGKVVHGSRPINNAAYAIHSRIHHARPDVIAAAHAHSRFGVTFSTLGKKLEPISQETCTFHGDHGLYDGYGGVAVVMDEGDHIAQALGHGKAVICRNHGLITVGHTVDEAAWWFIRMERACEQTLLANAAGKPIVLDDATARLTAKQTGAHAAGWYSFQPLVDKLLAEQPEVLK